MKKLTDGELDSVFKNAAEGYQPAFEQAAWEAMNARLNEPKPAFWKHWMSLTVIGLMIFSAGVWVGTSLHENHQMTQVKSEFNMQGPAVPEKKNIPTENAVTKKDQDNMQSTQVGKSNVPWDHNSKRQEINSKSTNLITQFNSANLLETSNALMVEESKSQVKETTNPVMEERSTLVSDNLIPVQRNDSTHNEGEEVNKVTILSKEEEPEKKNELSSSRSFYLSLLASPDFSSIGFASATSTGSNYAMLLEYQLTPRWSVSTGGIWSMKKYSSEEFTYGRYTADRMAGACSIVDIPLNIYYRFLPGQKTSFYAGIGLSSYIMLEEDYTYTFDSPSGSRDFYDYIEGENNEWFKVLNVSLGVQYRIAPRFHLQVEPFLKAPLAGVGEWDVKLSSMGVFMGLKYKIN